MSPLNAAFESRFPNGWLSRWEGALLEIQQVGYAVFFEELISEELSELSEYGKRRAADLISALRVFDAGGESCPRAVRDWVSGLEVAQAPGAAAVQVMTIHQSKGLGFDVVMLPGFPDGQIPSAQHFKIARGEGWLLQAPNAMVRDQVPALKEAFDAWSADQVYESMCLLYVALTRSKRGLYVFLDEESPTRQRKEEWKSPSNLIRVSAGGDYQAGDPNWTAAIPKRESREKKKLPELGEARPRRSRSTPSAAKGEISKGTKGRKIGNEVHALFEMIAWLQPGEMPPMEHSAAGKIVEDALQVPQLHKVFEDQGGELFREQQIEVIFDEKWMSGIVDRMHVYREGGEVKRIEVVDFKTDAVEALELLARYTGQMKAYRQALAKVFEVEEAVIDCHLFSTYLGELIKA
jgi:ATP-dependent exoDNAse (exonuclease V) beta subunit